MRPAYRLGIFGLLALACVAFSPGCSNDSTGPANTAATVHVRGTAGYSQDSVTITVGQSVMWIADEAGHTVTSTVMVGGIPGCTPNLGFDSGVMATSATFSHAFTTAGTFPYYCATANHCSANFESALIIVQ